MIATKLKENATRKMAPGLGQKNSATGSEKIFRALIVTIVASSVKSVLEFFVSFH